MVLMMGIHLCCNSDSFCQWNISFDSLVSTESFLLFTSIQISAFSQYHIGKGDVRAVGFNGRDGGATCPSQGQRGLAAPRGGQAQGCAHQGHHKPGSQTHSESGTCATKERLIPAHPEPGIAIHCCHTTVEWYGHGLYQVRLGLGAIRTLARNWRSLMAPRRFSLDPPMPPWTVRTFQGAVQHLRAEGYQAFLSGHVAPEGHHQVPDP